MELYSSRKKRYSAGQFVPATGSIPCGFSIVAYDEEDDLYFMNHLWHGTIPIRATDFVVIDQDGDVHIYTEDMFWRYFELEEEQDEYEEE